MNRARLRSSESGFVLIGVVMFVLALTILGLSLFNLSGFEAQFLEESRQDMQAFYQATGGIERAKLMLQTHGNLGAVKDGLPLEGITYARARFVNIPADSESIVNWKGDGNHDIEIRVLAVERGKRRLVEARYTPTRTSTTIYEHLLVSSGKIKVREDPDPSLLSLVGSSRQNHSNIDWLNLVIPPPPTHSIGGVPNADVQNYLNAHVGSAVQLSYPPDAHYNLLSPGNTHYLAPTHEGSDFGFRDSRPDVTFHVSGTAILLLPTGGGFERTVTVVGTPADRLVMVAGKSDNHELQYLVGDKTGLFFEGGIDSPQVPVILVSDGPIGIDQHHWVGSGKNEYDYGRTVVVNYLSVFADGILLGGPQPGYNATATYRHDSNLDPDVLDPLAQLGLLPNTTPGQTRKFPLVAGSWREVTETNPN